MKETLFTALVLMAVMVSLPAEGSHQLMNSPHNFTDGKGADSWYVLENTCEPCHTPSTYSDSAQTQQWEPEQNGSSLPVYNSDPFDTESGQPDGFSKLCMSCHDDSVAETMVMEQTSGGHPVGVGYDSRTVFRAEGELADPSIIDLPLYEGKIECPTCHDAHSNTEKLLRIENDGSRMCLRCHYK